MNLTRKPPSPEARPSLLKPFRRLSAWVGERVRAARTSDTERYLARATDIYDLERRMHRLERREAMPF